jgi:GTP-binding protein HflX
MPFNSASDAFQLHPDVRSYGTTLSAATGFGVDALVDVVQSELVRVSLTRVEVLVPYDKGSVLGEIRRAGVVESETWREDGTRVIAHVPVSAARRLASLGMTAVGGADLGADSDGADDVVATWSEEDEAELERLLREEEEEANT